MEIKIKRIGNTWGTVGWLAKGLEAGMLTITEGTTKTGTHGLWLNEYKKNDEGQLVKKNEWYIAGFNQFDLSPSDGCDIKYERADMYWGGIGGTPAFQRQIKEIAQEWVTEMNEMLKNEETIEIKLIRVEKETV